jgi:hypothetical protein
MFCISPEHSNSNTPAMILHDDGFKCQSCGVHGDIYDAAGLVCSIADIKDQFREVEKTLTGVSSENFPAGPVKKKEIKTDPAAIEEFESFVRNHPGREKGVKSFLKQRGYIDEIAFEMRDKFGYWPGIDEAQKKIPLERLELAGIPIPIEDKNFSSWFYSGVVVRLGFGYKLLFYKNGKCEKRNSISAKTFPCPKNENITGTAILVEAELSALSMLSVGFKNVYSTGGTNGITKYNVNKLLKCDNIIFAYDGDNSGRYFSGLDEYKIDKKNEIKQQPQTPIQKLYEAGYIGQIHAARLLETMDADDFLQAIKIEELREIINNAVEIIPPDTEVVSKEPKKTNDMPFQFLGYDEKAYYILPGFQQVALKISRGEQSIKNWLFELATEDWWFIKFNMEVITKEGEEKTIFDRKKALAWFREKSYQAGIFDEKKIKGVGAYVDNNKIIFNTGKNIKLCKGNTIDYDEWNGNNFYIKSKRHFKLSNKIWDAEEGRNLWEQINTFSFEKKMDKIAVAGFMIMSPFSSILWRRPSIWITAQTGIGKSFLIESLIAPSVGDGSYAFFSEGLSSEAFIRQSMKRDSVPIILDEFEAKNKIEQMNIVKVINLMRSSYERGKIVGKGSATHDPIVFNINSMFCFGSINVRLDNNADRSRIHVCRMRESVGNCISPKDFTGLRMRTFNMLPKILKEIDICKSKILKLGLNDRVADTYSPFLVGTWNLVSDNDFMDEKGGEVEAKIFDFFGRAISELTGKESVDDEDRIIERILQERIRIDTATEKTIAEMLTQYDGMVELGVLQYSKNLQRYGLKRFTMKDKTEVIAIAHNSPDISRFLENTPFTEYKEVIQRNRFVIDKSYPVKMAGKSERSVLLNWKEFNKMYLYDENEEKDENLPVFDN